MGQGYLYHNLCISGEEASSLLDGEDLLRLYRLVGKVGGKRAKIIEVLKHQ
jgi:hypothetical protein